MNLHFPTEPPLLELKSVTMLYRRGRREVPSVRGVSLRIEPGEFVVIMGPSGSGKSTLLQMLGGLSVPSTGHVLFRGSDIRRMRDHELSRLRLRRIGFVFQFFNLLPALTAAENVALPLLLGGERASNARETACAALAAMNLANRVDHMPDELSGGELQRVALARALVTDPDVILCDEPTGSLDSQSGQEVLARLRSLPEPGRRSVVMVTHDASAAAFGDRVIHIRDGRIEAEDPARGRHVCAATRS